ncbi:MAG: phage tail length tape measure family protein, partial [Burkholderiales bacterium]|nr:phage tail length tape measure family protein [Burkholderiales bacterium]
MAPLNAGFVRMGASANAARAHVANLSFQLSDIAMMTAAGQNPLMLAAQQGAQVTQVFGQMRAEGLAIGPALARSFGMFLNPLSLAAMGVIAFGAAAVQWFLKADAAAVPLEETTERLAQSMGALREATREALVPMRELREEWGAQAGAVRGLRGEQALLAQSQARLDLANQARALAAMRATGGVTNLPGAAGWQATLQEGGYDLLAREQRDLAAVLASVDWAGPPEALAESLRAANAEIGAIMARIQADGKTITEPFAALSKLLLDFEMNARTVVGSIAATAGDADRLAGALDRRGAAMKAAAKDWLGETLRGVEAERARQAELAAGNQALRERIAARQAEAAMAELVARYGDESHEVAIARLAAERAVEQAIVDAAGGTEALKREAMEAWDALKGIATAAGQISFGAANAGAAELARKLGVSLGLAQQLAGLGLGEAALEEGDGRGSQREGRANARAFHREQWMAQNTARLAALRDKALGITPAGVDGASGAGGGAAEISAAARLLEAQREELALLRTLDPVQREVIKNREALAAAGVKEAAAIRENIVELVRLREVEAAVKEIGAAGRDAFVGLVTGTLSLKEALGQLIGKLAEMAASSAWDILWEGGKGGGGGLGGLLIDWLSGGIGKKPDAGKKADGGRVSGPGGPRQDNL